VTYHQWLADKVEEALDRKEEESFIRSGGRYRIRPPRCNQPRPKPPPELFPFEQPLERYHLSRQEQEAYDLRMGITPEKSKAEKVPKKPDLFS
jgi:hypothetical protein